MHFPELLLAYCCLFVHLCYFKCSFEPSARILIVVHFPMDLRKVCPHIFRLRPSYHGLQYLHPFHRLALTLLIVPGDLWKEPSVTVDEVFQADVSSEDS